MLEQASESFKIQLLRDDDNGDEVLSIDKIQADQSPIIRLVDSTVFDALNRRASDIHIETRDSEVVIKYRIDGVLQPAMKPIAKEHHSTIISRIKVMSELDIAEKRVPQDGRFRVKIGGRSIDFRVSIMPSVHGEDAVIRILDKESLSKQFASLRLDVLGFDEKELQHFRRFIREPYGMVLVTGPTGSGKTTTLYAALSEIQTEEDKIITIEDPVEYQLKGITQIPVNEKKGLTFARGLRSILRHDPDKVMVGEIRDPETADIAIQSALTGHLVFTTVHANNVIDVLGRFLNMKIEPYNFVSALNCVQAQRLVRTICAHCKREVRASRELLVESGLDPARYADVPFYEGAGCIECGGTGYKGRTAICELLDVSDTHPRAHPRPPVERRHQAGGARGGDDLPARVRGEQGARREDDAPGDQQGHLRGGGVSAAAGRLGGLAAAGGPLARPHAGGAAPAAPRDRGAAAGAGGGPPRSARAGGCPWGRRPRSSCRRAPSRCPWPGRT